MVDWVPKTRLGHMVLNGEVTTMSEALATKLPLREPEIVDILLPDLKDEVWPDDIETLDALKVRASGFLDFVRVTYPGKRVLAVGHGIINKAIQSVYYGIKMNEVEKMENAEVRILEL